MKVERTPFTIFDFIGYFIPGFIFLYTLYLTFDIEFASILTCEKKEIISASHEYLVFTVFMILFAWFVGHLLSWVSHLLFEKKARKIFDNDEKECTCPLLDPFVQGKRSIFPKSKTEYESIVDTLFGDLIQDPKIPERLKPLLKDGEKKLFLQSISNYLDPEKYKTVYNYLVIHGAFRTFALVFLIHIIVLCLGMLFELHLEPWVKGHFIYILVSDLVIVFICWNIYLKYLRREIEETAVLLIYERYLRKDDKL